MALGSIQAQNSFYKTISSNYNIWGFNTIQTTDGGYATIGTNIFNATYTHQNVLVVKTDANGDTLWTRSYGGAAADGGWGIIQTIDGGYLISSQASSFGPNAPNDDQGYLVKADAIGDTLWTKIYGGMGKESLNYCVQKNDEGYVCFGTTSSFGAGANDFYLLNLNANGDTISTRCYGGIGDDIPNNFVPTPDKGYLLCGYSNSFSIGNATNDVYVVKTDSLFNMQWSKTYGGSEDDYGFNIIKTSSGNYIISGFTSSFGGANDTTKGYAICINLLGDTLWTKVYTYSGQTEFYDVIETADSNLLYTGFSSGWQLTLTKTKPNGDILGGKLYGIDLAQISGSMSNTADGGAIISVPANSYSLGVILKLDSNYNVSCLGTAVSPTVQSPPTIITNVPTQQHNTATITRGTHTQLGYGCTITTVCNNTGIEQYTNTNNGQLNIYPNPASNKVQVAYTGAIVNINLYDVLGKEVISTKQKEIDVSTLSEGVYFMQVKTAEGILSKKIIVQH